MIQPLEPRVLFSNLRFAAIGDFGDGSSNEHQVAHLVKSWNPDLVITVGDNNYPVGSANTIDRNIGADYHQFIYPYRGKYGSGSASGKNDFFPSMGNHDWYSDSGRPFFNYFKLPGNERYYTFTRGPVQFFAIDSDPSDPDLGYRGSNISTANSREGRWLKNALAKSTATWKIVFFHHAPYSSGVVHGSARWMRWPFAQWGASAVLSGHEHDYERLIVKGTPYFVNGSGGDSLYKFGQPLTSSKRRYNRDYGAMLISADDTTLRFQFVNRTGKTIDTYTMTQPQHALA